MFKIFAMETMGITYRCPSFGVTSLFKETNVDLVSVIWLCNPLSVRLSPTDISYYFELSSYYETINDLTQYNVKVVLSIAAYG